MYRARFVLVAISLTSLVAIVFYAVTTTIAADTAVRPYAMTVGAALIVVLLIAGYIDPDRVKDGFLPAVFEVLPRLCRWSARASFGSVLTTLIALTGSALAIWLGPRSVKSISIACDEATQIRIFSEKQRRECPGALSVPLWLPPIVGSRPLIFTCVDSEGNEWPGTTQTSTAGICGARPTNSRYVKNGIQPLAIDPDTVVGKRTREGVQRLRRALADGTIPDRNLKDRLLIATWNLHYLGRGNRLVESYAYIAEVISHFDIMAIQEIMDPIALGRIMAHLGRNYKHELGFVSPRSGERVGFIYDSRKVALGDLSTSIVVETGQDDLPQTSQPLRPPFLAEFVVNGRPFFLVTAHIYYGGSSGKRFNRRLAELRVVATYLRKVVEKYYPTHALILAGDLNVSKRDGPEMLVLEEAGFASDDKLAALGSNWTGTKPYDQILVLNSERAPLEFGKVGVFAVLEYVFRDDEWDNYKIDFARIARKRVEETSAEDLETKYRQRMGTSQISDHRVKWAEFRLTGGE